MSDPTDIVDSGTAEPIQPDELVKVLRGLRARIPRYQQMTVRQAQSMRRVAYLDPAFIDAGINAARASDRTSMAIGRTAEELRVEQRDTGRWTAVEDELRAMLDGVTAANLERRYDLGRMALAIYTIIRQLARHKENAFLIPWIEAMKRANPLGHKRKKSAAAEGDGEPGAGAGTEVQDNAE
jgi:hypothetical protein